MSSNKKITNIIIREINNNDNNNNNNNNIYKILEIKQLE
jgi:hypothetical protein